MRNSNAALGRYCGIAGAHLQLHLDRTAHGGDDAGELDQEAVAGGFDDTTAMLGDFRIAELAPNRTQRRQRALFVLAHQPRIAGDIDRQNGRQSSLDPLSSWVHGHDATAISLCTIASEGGPSLAFGSVTRYMSGPLCSDG
jgi:hypothetical protein